MPKNPVPFTKRDPDFIEHVRKHTTLDKETGTLKFDKFYVAVHLNFQWKGNKVFMPHSHFVWFLTRGSWPKEGYVIDHINDDPQDNRPENLQELTHAESQEKRRGRMVYRSYGTGKYGYGLYVHHDKRDNRYYITRHLSRGHGKGDLKSIRRGLGGFDTIEEAEEAVRKNIDLIKSEGLDYLPQSPTAEKKITKNLNTMTETFREMRRSGMTLQEIQDATGFKSGVYNRIKDIGVDGRSRSRGEGNNAAKLTEDQVREIRRLYAEGKTIKELVELFGIGQINRIIKRKAWKHVE
jgi:hypothetical protein